MGFILLPRDFLESDRSLFKNPQLKYETHGVKIKQNEGGCQTHTTYFIIGCQIKKYREYKSNNKGKTFILCQALV